MTITISDKKISKLKNQYTLEMENVQEAKRNSFIQNEFLTNSSQDQTPDYISIQRKPVNPYFILKLKEIDEELIFKDTSRRLNISKAYLRRRNAIDYSSN